ncbi:response regulator [Candidatus Dojkabacteria bacterium]|nr:response regulator [Candidatus Dojkabacteria bacterium]
MADNSNIGDKKRILIVDDEPFILNIYEDLFSDAGFEVHKASNGEEALNQLPSMRFDVILLDIFMPIMDGVAFLTNFNEQSFRDEQGIVIITTNYEPDSISELQELYNNYSSPKELGVVDHIIKANIDLDELLKKVTSHLSQ